MNQQQQQLIQFLADIRSDIHLFKKITSDAYIQFIIVLGFSILSTFTKYIIRPTVSMQYICIVFIVYFGLSIPIMYMFKRQIRKKIKRLEFMENRILGALNLLDPNKCV